jgi:dihydrofolate reductase
MNRCIVAIDKKRGLADNNGIPWSLPSDQKWFVDQTAKGLILMGMGTYREFKTPMHDRTNYVVTHSNEELLPGFVRVNDVAQFYKEHTGETINNIGGAGLFSTTLQFADKLVITLVDADFHCTKFFPSYEKDFVCAKQYAPLTENGITFRFTIWHRRVTGD